jgi:hypothetical protein
MDENKMTVLESIIRDVAQALFQKWSDALPEDQKTELNVNNLSKNSLDTTYFVVKLFMDKFNEAAEVLKPIDDPENI